MLVIGITGGIGSGKGLAADFFRSRGAVILDADEIARELTRPGSPLLQQIAVAFGEQYLREDGSLDRRKLAETVFADLSLVAELNAITHPRILAEIRRRLDELRRGACPARGPRGEPPPQVVCIVAPLLLEAGGERMVDHILLVTASEEERIRRVMKRDGLTVQAVRQRLAAQMSPQEQMKRADWVVDTTAGREAGLQQLEMVREKIADTLG